MNTKYTKALFSSSLKPSSLKNLEPMTNFDFMILVLAFFANCLRIGFDSTFLELDKNTKNKFTVCPMTMTQLLFYKKH